ncbi:MAG: Uma2 family endonuclease [Microcoleus sp. PH2017_15_JOR_U_A]|uniref:Uma2 family endonuclease n=1 Tax=unclassified Microcoleus TaxID=2642155 RepID=UPI001D20E5B4|nr:MULTISPECIES: Uma2 family endonuclease [unclassified Microcoleus]MCC3499403.1 Uma2 family endonuclease [Microcoleus sp. PH2017_15_JOR_U_A]MCC3599804.1 Uma2 family endonuclease [Microcoleus sp. PH2017_26_ELK_O_A]MCC3624813.1 Uma2 family endonuclease [Microcoleus sp. PH2017_36_ELK_O_B]TAE56620.1 MAG: Uma2 family endonuclease [Oscillatoriales cyanobacterium]
MLTSIQSPSKISLEEFLVLPETKPASEYVDGQIYQKDMPQGKHSTLQTRFGNRINQVGEPQKLAFAFPELRCTFDGRSIVPDIAVFEWSRIPLNANGKIENIFQIAPDWIIEILSPDQSSSRVINKILFCLKNQTKLGWLIDPEEQLVIVFQPQQEPEIKENEDVLPVLHVLSDLQLSAANLFDLLSFN